jgi:hypothetical protein
VHLPKLLDRGKLWLCCRFKKIEKNRYDDDLAEKIAVEEYVHGSEVSAKIRYSSSPRSRPLVLGASVPGHESSSVVSSRVPVDCFTALCKRCFRDHPTCRSLERNNLRSSTNRFVSRTWIICCSDSHPGSPKF